MYSAVATTMNKIIGNAKVSIDPPKVHAPPGESAITMCTPVPFFLFGPRRSRSHSKSVEQQPEQQRHYGHVAPDGGEGAQRRLEPLHQVGLSVRGGLFDERQGRDVPGPG